MIRENHRLGARSMKKSPGIRKPLAILTSALFLLNLAACGAANEEPSSSPQPTTTSEANAPTSASPPAAQPVTIKHEFGETTVASHPKRIASYDMEDMLLALNVPLVQAFSSDGFYLDEQLKEKGIPINSSMNLSLEAIASVDPDLIIINKNMLDPDSYRQISKIAPTLPLSRDDWQQTLPMIGQVLGMEDQAQAIADGYKAKLQAAKEKIVSKIGEDKTVAFIRPSTKDVELDFPDWTWTSLLYNDLGLKPDPSVLEIERQSKDTWGGTMISLEKLPELSADYLFMDFGSSLSKEADFQKEVAMSAEVEKLGVWSSIPAVRQGDVYKVSARHWALNGPIADGLKIDDAIRALTGE